MARAARNTRAVVGLVAMTLALFSVGSVFIPQGPAPFRAGATASAVAAAGAALPAFAEEAEKAPEGLLNFGKIELGGGFAINLDIPETNIINISVLIAGLLYLLAPVLGESMSTREKEIQRDIDDAIAKYNEAAARLAEAQKAQAQANQVIAEINGSIEKDQKEFEAQFKANAEKQLERQTRASELLLKEIEAGAQQQVDSYVQKEAVLRAVKELQVLEQAKTSKLLDLAIKSL